MHSTKFFPRTSVAKQVCTHYLSKQSKQWVEIDIETQADTRRCVFS